MPDFTSSNCSISQAIAWACQDAGVAVATCVPGSGGTDVFEWFRLHLETRYPYSFNEETAYAIAHGAALTGVRSAALVKAHGLLKAANAVSDSLFTGTTAGFLTIVFTDKDGSHSDSILDIRPVLDGMGIPWEQADIGNLYEQVQSLYRRSESSLLPFVLVVETSDCVLRVPIPDRIVLPQPVNHYVRNICQHVLCPFFSTYQSRVLNARIDGNTGNTIPAPGIPTIPRDVPGRWQPLISAYSPLFQVFHSIRGSIVTGETGVSSLFACEPFHCIDITTYMGGSIPLAIGAMLAGCHDAWAVTGDFSFVAAGHMGLTEAVMRNLPLKILLLCNGMSATTGGQPVPQYAIEKLLCEYSKYVVTINAADDQKQLLPALQQAAYSSDLTIVVAKYCWKG